MNGITLNLRKISYNDLNSRQKENYNYAHVAAVLADYGFTSMRLTDDWQGPDFIAQHIDGEQFIKVQLKSRLWVNTKYKGKNIWICFRALSSGAKIEQGDLPHFAADALGADESVGEVAGVIGAVQVQSVRLWHYKMKLKNKYQLKQWVTNLLGQK
jgi:hypothetical protein